eukprot:7550426-Karenia_brevis.AAC.1
MGLSDATPPEEDESEHTDDENIDDEEPVEDADDDCELAVDDVGESAFLDVEDRDLEVHNTPSQSGVLLLRRPSKR